MSMLVTLILLSLPLLVFLGAMVVYVGQRAKDYLMSLVILGGATGVMVGIFWILKLIADMALL